MSTALRFPITEAALLALLVAVCWIGIIGMWRMREPMQALHFLALPTSVAATLLLVAVFLEQGKPQTSWKTLVISLVLFAINSVGAHATARAFRTRELGHWEPRDGDPIEFVRNTHPGARP